MSYKKELAFGLDIGDRSLKILQFRTQGKKIHLRGFSETVLPQGLMRDGEIIEYEALAAHIKTAARKTGIVAEHVITALPEAKTFLKLLLVPTNDAVPPAQGVETELRRHLPFELSEVWWDFKIIKKLETSLLVLAGAAPRKLIDSYMKLFRLSGIAPVVLDLEPLAIARALIKESVAPICYALADLGATKSTLIMATPDTVLSTADGRSAGNTLTEQLSAKLGIDAKTAEEMKRKCGLGNGTPEYLAVAREYADTLARRIRETIAFTLAHAAHYPAASEILLSGGGALLKGLPEHLSTVLKLPVKIADPWVNARNEIGREIGAEASPRFATACGLALTALTYDHTS